MAPITTHLLLAPTLLLLSSLVNVASATGYVHSLKPNINKPKPQLYAQPQPKFEHIGIEGRVMCRQGSRVVPLEDENGYETAPFSKSNPPSDSKGYFFDTLCRSEVGEKMKLKECNVFLESSPLETPLITSCYHRLFNGKIYSLQPFSFTSQEQEPESTVPNGY